MSKLLILIFLYDLKDQSMFQKIKKSYPRVGFCQNCLNVLTWNINFDVDFDVQRVKAIHQLFAFATICASTSSKFIYFKTILVRSMQQAINSNFSFCFYYTLPVS